METLTEHQLKALDYSNHLSLTANAGSGKTFVLSRRYIEIALNEDLDLQNIAAITFTEKAASELYKKIAVQIRERIENESDRTILKRLEKIRRQLVSANISTIHSFCIDILKQFPVEAELDANFIPIDEQLSNDLIELSVDELIKNFIREPAEEKNLKDLIRIFASKNLFTRELISLIKNRKNVFEAADKIYLESKSEEEIAAFYFSSFSEMCRHIFFKDKQKIIASIEAINKEVLNSDGQNSLALEIAALLEKLKKTNEPESKINCFSLIREKILTNKNKIRSQKYLKKGTVNLTAEIDIIESFFGDFSKLPSLDDHHQIEIELAKFGKTIIHFFYEALEIYNNKKVENGYLDYEDILLFTKKILSNEEVQKTLAGKFKYLMIDEYQDTNELQYQIFLPILDDLKKGKLFVVGDEKQSIYMFRDAELEVFYKTKDEIEKTAGKNYLLTLPDSFRMAPQICAFTNLLFGKLFNNPDPLFNEVEHSEIVCAKQDDLSGRTEILLNIDTGTNQITEAELVARRIKMLINSTGSGKQFVWNDIAVLVRKRKSFSELEEAFTGHKIPYTIIGGKGFYQRQTIYDIYNYFSFLLDENNDASLVGILRSPFFTVSDAEIFEISLKAGKNFWSKLNVYSRDEKKLEREVNQLKENKSLAGNYNLASLLRKILNETPFISAISSKPNGSQEIANIEKLIKLTINFSTQGFFTLFDYVNYLKTSIEQSEDEAQAAISEESNAVKIMTLHQAKGLEFNAVFLYRCNDTSQKDMVVAKSVTVNKNFGILTKVPVSGNFFGEYKSAPIVGINNIIAAKKNSAELKRLFYVGVTRAKNYLFLSATTNEQLKLGKGSFLELLLKGLNIDLNKDSFEEDFKLKFLKIENEKFNTIEEDIALKIPIYKEFPEAETFNSEELKSKSENEFRTSEIEDFPEGEIISATKIAIFNQCPVKYQLTYEYGFSNIYESYKNWQSKQSKFVKTSFDFNSKEDKILAIQNEDERISLASYADLKGRIIHKILQDEIAIPDIEEFLVKEIEGENESIDIDETAAEQLKKNILNDILRFVESKTFTGIRDYKRYKNEFEIYIKENDYYLYGIIDKLILDENKAVIIDYKTDDITGNEISIRSEIYLLQLKFYAYIVNRLYPGLKQIRLKLLFIKHPDSPIEINIKEKDFILMKNMIFEMITNVRNKNMTKNLSHCQKCRFYFNSQKCIKD